MNFIFVLLFAYGGNSVQQVEESISSKAVRVLYPGFQQAQVYRSSINGHDAYKSDIQIHYGLTKSTNSDLYVKMNIAGVEFKEYSPNLFSVLRKNAGVSDFILENSLDSNNLDCLSADSKSGQAFWRASNGLVVVKTLKSYECKNLRNILDRFTAHMTSGHSCICAVLGLYRIKFKNGKKKYFLVCKNVYQKLKNNNFPSTKYDLKGSTVGRQKSISSSVYKDLDLMASNFKLQLGPAKSILLETLHRDVTFLSACQFMDYSLLVDVEHNYISNNLRRFANRILKPISISWWDRGKLVVLGSDGHVYHFGIIDFLQRYTFRKVLETFIKGFYYDVKKISCVAPRQYAIRMLTFMEQQTL